MRAALVMAFALWALGCGSAAAQEAPASPGADVGAHVARGAYEIRVSCQWRPPDDASSQAQWALRLPPELGRQRGTGVFVAADGTMLTTRHTLANVLAQTKAQAKASAAGAGKLACAPGAERIVVLIPGGPDGRPFEAPARILQDPRLLDAQALEKVDVMMLKAETQGLPPLYALCAPPGEEWTREGAYRGLKVWAAGFASIPEEGPDVRGPQAGEPRLRRGMGGLTGDGDRGAPWFMTFLGKDAFAFSPGMSGGPIVDPQGRLVGLIEGYRPDDNPRASVDLAVPLARFHKALPQEAFCRSEPPGPRRPEMKPVPAGKLGSAPIAAFEMAATETTFEQWDECVKDDACRHASPLEGWGRGRMPVMLVSQEDAQAYVDWLNSLDGRALYRLPTEEEWEYAALAGSLAPYAFGGGIAEDQARFGEFDPLKGRPLPVGSFAPNAFGLYDMHGNVWEWIAARGVFKGGAFDSPASKATAAARGRRNPARRYHNIGFRVARSPPT